MVIFQADRKAYEEFPKEINKTPPEQKKIKDIYFHYGKAKY
jgi:hypothetical protein